MIDNQNIEKIRGCIAGLVDSGIVKIASEDFEPLCKIVENSISGSYTIEKIAYTLSKILNTGDLYV